MFALLPRLRVARDILVFPYFFFNRDVETKLLFYLAHCAILNTLVCNPRVVTDFTLRERPVAKDIMHEREVQLVLVTCIHNSTAEALHRHLCIRDVFLLFRYLVFTGLAKLLVDRAKDAVYKAPAVFAAKTL